MLVCVCEKIKSTVLKKKKNNNKIKRKERKYCMRLKNKKNINLFRHFCLECLQIEKEEKKEKK